MAVELVLLFGCEVDALGLLLGFGCFALGLGWEGRFFFAQQGVFLCLLARGFGSLLGGGLSMSMSAYGY
jgi:hypothetical protein